MNMHVMKFLAASFCLFAAGGAMAQSRLRGH